MNDISSIPHNPASDSSEGFAYATICALLAGMLVSKT